jgi:hypothetical protein
MKIIVVGNKVDLVKDNKVYKPVDEDAWRKI